MGMIDTTPDEELLWLIFWAGLLVLVGLIAWEILRGSQGPPKGPGVLQSQWSRGKSKRLTGALRGLREG